MIFIKYLLDCDEYDSTVLNAHICAAQITTHSVCKEQVLNQRVVFIECRVESLVVYMPHIDKECSNFYDKDMSLDAERHRVWCAWASFIFAQFVDIS